MADVRQCARPADEDDDEDEPGPATVLSDRVTQRQARWLRILFKLPHAMQREVLQLLAEGASPSDLPADIRTPDDVKQLVEDLAAFGGHGGVRPRLAHVPDAVHCPCAYADPDSRAYARRSLLTDHVQR